MNKIIFLLCLKHRKCAQTVFNMNNPLCKLKYCPMQKYRSIVRAYKKTIERINK